MKILSLKIAGPMQSWGTISKHTPQRRTENFPTKSGLTGLFAASLGITRTETEKLQQSGLLELQIVVREDHTGTLLSDYQTIKVDKSTKKLTTKSYLTDAIFLVGVYGDEALLEKLAHSLKNPKFALFYGRKTCTVNHDMVQAINEYSSEEQFLTSHPFLTPEHKIKHYDKKKQLFALTTIQTSTEANTGELLQDQPVSFASEKRIHQARMIKRSTVKIPNPFYQEPHQTPTHDPFDILERTE
jgi:CRISPR system Cascade subunit CasD